MAKDAVKRFRFEEGSTEGMHYSIRVVGWMGQIIEEFVRPTMQEAHRAFENAGYRIVDSSYSSGELDSLLVRQRSPYG